MFESVLVANRGEAACRVIRTLREQGVRSVAVASDGDLSARHAREADAVVHLEGDAPAETYLSIDKVARAALEKGVDAVHPAYGFLAESARAAEAIRAEGLTFIGPSADAIEAMADKTRARVLATRVGLPVSRGTDDAIVDLDAAVVAAERIEYPLMIKPSAGGGGIGMVVVEDEQSLRKAFETTRSRAERLFGSGALLLEEFVPDARHVEVQVLGLRTGEVVILGDRDCTAQRRYQKVAEETPSPAIGEGLRQELHAGAKTFSESLGYEGAGTVEFLVDESRGRFVFLEMNTRLQVEHPITELTFGIDLVLEQLRIASGDAPGFDPLHPPQPSGHAIELRVCAEDPRTFRPSPGRITSWKAPTGAGIRVDSGYTEGDHVSPYFDSLLAKLCAVGEDRAEALERLRDAADRFVIDGPKVNLPFFHRLLRDPEFVSGRYRNDIVTRNI